MGNQNKKEVTHLQSSHANFQTAQILNEKDKKFIRASLRSE
jgi:hypothetical protein